MELSKNHRQALLNRLEKALIKKPILKDSLNGELAKNDLKFSEFLEIEDFLNNKEIELLKESLVDIEIDY